MRILVSNDDGIRAQGLRALAEGLGAAGHEVTVSAPAMEQSCSGHSFTLDRPLFAAPAPGWGALKAYEVRGTPADCVRWAIENLVSAPVDLVVSGINHGANLGSDTVYSGTVSAAMEAAMMGYRALAVSLCARRTMDFAPAVAIALRVIERIGEWPAGRVYNLNVPALSLCEIRGVRPAPLALRRYEGPYEARMSPLGGAYFWSAGKLNEGLIGPEADSARVAEGWATLTPLQWDMTDRGLLSRLSEQSL